MSEWVKVRNTGQLGPGEVQVVTPRGERIALCNVEGQYYAIDDVCTHDGGSLDQGEIIGDEIECPRHGAHFSVKTGQALTLPAVLAVRTYPVKIEGDDILVEV